MRPVLFYLPIVNIPVYGYGLMLFLAFVLCGWLGARLARREGINPNRVYDLMLWLFLSGILGARILYVYEDWEAFRRADLLSFFKLWDGGLVFYGSMFGGAIGYYAYYYFVLRKEGVSNWKMADVVAPCLALGACLGRIGCLLTGCCFGNVACAECIPLHFPMPNGPNKEMIDQGYETPLGFVLQPDGRVGAVEADSPAWHAGLRTGDTLLKVNGRPVEEITDKDGKKGLVEPPRGLYLHLFGDWPRGQLDAYLRVQHANGQEETLPPFRAWSLGSYPTQVFESISMALLLFFLLSYYPFKARDGALLVLMMVGYGIHRFLNEMLRTDNKITATGLTLSQNISIAILIGAAVLAYFVWRRPAPDHAPAAEPAEPIATGA